MIEYTFNFFFLQCFIIIMKIFYDNKKNYWLLYKRYINIKKMAIKWKWINFEELVNSVFHCHSKVVDKFVIKFF